MKYFCLGALFSLSTSGLVAQESADSIVMRYLRSKPDIPAPFLKVEKKGGNAIRSQNFFNEPNTPINNDTINIVTFLFGSSASHSRKFFLIQIKAPHESTYKIIDDDHLGTAVNDLLKYLAPYKLSESKRAVLVNQLTYTYY